MYTDNILILMKNFGTMVFLLCSMTTFHQAYSIIRVPSYRKVYVMASSAIYLSFLFYLVFGLFAYFSLGEKLKDYDLFPERPPLKGSSDILNKILKISKNFYQNLQLVFGFSISVAYLSMVLPIKDVIVTTFKLEYTWYQNMFITLFLVSTSSFLAFAIPHVSTWLNIIGSFVGIFLAFVIPSACFVAHYKDAEGYRLAIVFSVIYGVVLGIIGISCSIVDVLLIFKVINEE